MENKDKDRHFTVYKHTTPNNKCYIGITGQKKLFKKMAKRIWIQRTSFLLCHLEIWLE